MAPPMQVAAPPKGSISVGWLWVSFLKNSSQSSSPSRVSALMRMVQALFSSVSSNSGSLPCFLRAEAAMVATSIRVMGLFLPSAFRVAR